MIRNTKQSSNANEPVRRTHLHRVLGVSALTALGCVTAANAAIKTDIGVDYRATGFYVESESFSATNTDPQTDPNDSDNGFAHYLRVKADFKHEETGVSVHTRVELAGDRWSGDGRNYNTDSDYAFNGGNDGDNVRLDLGFVQIPFKFGLLRVGRQEANWNNCFLVCDDRRDRAIFLTKLGDVSAFAGYDRRQDNASFYNEDNGDMALAGLVAPLGESDWSLGLLYVHWFNNYNGDIFVPGNPAVDFPGSPVDTNGDGVPDSYARGVYPISNVNLYSPYMQGKVGPMDVAFGGNWFENGNVNANQTPEGGDYFTDDAYSAYFRLGADLGMFELKGQYIGTWDGGLISSGFDTYSSLINSSPESTANPTSLYTMGSQLGREGFDESLYIGSIGVNVTEKFAVRGAVGFLDIEVPDGTGGTDSDTSTVYDLQASYQLNEAVRTWATLGMLKENDVGTLSGNSLVGTMPNGGSFADDRVIAGSVNLGVTF